MLAPQSSSTSEAAFGRRKSDPRLRHVAEAADWVDRRAALEVERRR